MANFDLNETDLGVILSQIMAGKTPRSMLDSGGQMWLDENNEIRVKNGYGTSSDRLRLTAQKHQITPHEYLESLPESTFCIHNERNLEWSHSGYHWLKDRLKYRHDITRKFYDFLDFVWAHDNDGQISGKEIYENMVDGAEFFLKNIYLFWPDEAQDWDDMPYEEWLSRYDMLVAYLDWVDKYTTIHIWDDDYCTSDNTYNYDNLLDETILWYQHVDEEDSLLALSLHGGADVRGGYQDVFFAESTWCDEWLMHFISDGTLDCSNPECNATWHTDDGWHLYNNSDRDLNFKIGDDVDPAWVYVDDEGEATGEMICPQCLCGILEPYL